MGGEARGHITGHSSTVFQTEGFLLHASHLSPQEARATLPLFSNCSRSSFPAPESPSHTALQIWSPPTLGGQGHCPLLLLLLWVRH